MMSLYQGPGNMISPARGAFVTMLGPKAYFDWHHEHLAKGLAILLMVIERMGKNIAGPNIDFRCNGCDKLQYVSVN